MNLNSLKAFMEERKAEFVPSRTNPSWDESEDKAWAVQEYLGCVGELTEEDTKYLQETDPELLALAEEDAEQTEEALKNHPNPALESEEGTEKVYIAEDAIANQIIAIFPEIPFSTKPLKEFCTGFTVEEGHTEVSIEYAESLPPATDEDQLKMLDRLREAGYHPKAIDAYGFLMATGKVGG